jgi:hypothetical protein
LKTSLILAALLLTACCTQPAPPEAQPKAEATLTLGADGISSLNGQVPFTLPAIERAFEDFEVVAAPNAGEPVFHVREPGSPNTLFIVSPDWTRGFVGSVTAVLPPSAGGLEIQAGVTPQAALQERLGTACADFRCEIPLSGGSLILRFPAGGENPLLDEIAYVPAQNGP